MILIYINDLIESCSNICHINNFGNIDNLQTGIERLVQWTDRWQVKLNIDKCKVVSFSPEISK